MDTFCIATAFDPLSNWTGVMRIYNPLSLTWWWNHWSWPWPQLLSQLHHFLRNVAAWWASWSWLSPAPLPPPALMIGHTFEMFWLSRKTHSSTGGTTSSASPTFSTGLQSPGNTSIISPSRAGPRLNIKTVLSTYGDFHVKDKTAVRTSYL